MDIRKIVFFDAKLRAEQKKAWAFVKNAKDDATRARLLIVYKKWLEEKLLSISKTD